MTKTNTSSNIRKLVLSGVFLALCLLLPFLTGQIPQIGSMLAPMHLPVMLCGFVCGWPWGLVVGVVAPLLRGVIFGMPPFLPTGLAMAFELAAYGALCGLLYKLFPKKSGYIYLSLVISMLLGRVVWGLAALGIHTALGNPFTFKMFVTAAFVRAVPGIILQLVLVPPIVIALKRAWLMRE